MECMTKTSLSNHFIHCFTTFYKIRVTVHHSISKSYLSTPFYLVGHWLLACTAHFTSISAASRTPGYLMLLFPIWWTRWTMPSPLTYPTHAYSGWATCNMFKLPFLQSYYRGSLPSRTFFNTGLNPSAFFPFPLHCYLFYLPWKPAQF